MGKRDLPNGFWTDFDGLKELYKEDFEMAKALEKNTREIDFINLHFLPQMIEAFENKKNTYLPQKLAYKSMIEFLETRAAELNKSEFNFEKDLAKANQISDLSDRLFYWQSRLNDYYRLYKYKGGINITLVLDGFSYEQLVEHEIEFIEAHLKAKEKKPSKSLRSSKPKPSISFVWQGNAETELPKLHQRLIKAEMIDEQTDLKDFIATFTGQPTDNTKPIKWIDSNRLLAYFVDTCFSGQDWQSIAHNGKLFQNKKGKLLTQSDLSSANDRKFGKPKGSEKIDEILTAIKKH